MPGVFHWSGAFAVAFFPAFASALASLLLTSDPLPQRRSRRTRPRRGDVQGRTSFFDETGMSRRKIPAAEWTRRAQRVGRVGRACFLWATFLCTSKEEPFQQPNGWSRWLAPRRGVKAFDPVSALALAFPGRLYQRDSQRTKAEAKAEAKHESGSLKAELSLLLRRSELLLFARAKRSNQEKHAPASAPCPLRGLGPLRQRDFSTRHPCLVEKRRASMRVALRVFPAGSVAAEGDPESQKQRQQLQL